MNTINNNTNITFNARYLKINDNVPKKIADAVYKSDAIEYFLYKEPKKKSLLNRLLDLFRRDEVLEVTSLGAPEQKELPKINIGKDIYKHAALIKFSFYRKGTPPIKHKTFDLRAFQEGQRSCRHHAADGREYYFYNKPTESAEDKIVKQIEEISDLKKRFNDEEKPITEIEDFDI